MAVLDVSTATNIIKFLYPDYTVPRELRKTNPFFSMLAKKTNFVGKSVEVPLTINTTQGGSALFSAAKTANELSTSYSDTYKTFTLTRKSDYSLATISGEAMKAAVMDEGAMVDLFQDTIDLAMMTAMRSIARNLFRDGCAWAGKVGSVSGSTITLATPSDAFNFDLGERVEVFSSTTYLMDAIVAGTAGATVRRITAVDRKAGTITLNDILNVAAPQYIARAGDRTVAASDTEVFTNSRVVTGVSQWLAGSQTGAVTGANAGAQLQAAIYGVTRTTDKTSLAGNSLDCTGAAPDEAIIQLASDINAEGGRPDHCFLNPRDFASLVKFLGSRTVYDRAVSIEDAEIGFQAVTLMGDAGPLKCVSDINVPQSQIFALQLDSWDLFSLNAAPHILDYDNQQILRVSDDDAYQIRIGSYANLRCRAPAFNGRGFNYLATTTY
jgi:hypothetical protein